MINRESELAVTLNTAATSCSIEDNPLHAITAPEGQSGMAVSNLRIMPRPTVFSRQTVQHAIQIVLYRTQPWHPSGA